MAFSSSKVRRSTVGNIRIVLGTFTNGAADSGGAIATGLKAIYFFGATIDSHLGSEQPKVTLSSGTATIVTSTGADGTWVAVGL